MSQRQSRSVALLLSGMALLALLHGSAAQDFGSELSKLSFDNLIFNPLAAVMQAQMLSARETIEYVMNVGFTKPTEQGGLPMAKLMTFAYTSADAEGGYRTGSVVIPLISMVPIPYLRVEQTTIEFNTKLASSDTFGIGMTLGVEAGGGVWTPSYSVAASVSVQSSFNSSFTNSREYSMRVSVTATSPEVPEGAMKLFDALRKLTRTKTKASSH